MIEEGNRGAEISFRSPGMKPVFVAVDDYIHAAGGFDTL
jgi:hypothetical protein